MHAQFDFIIQPGWNNSPARHWQSHWQQRLDARRVGNGNWQQPVLDDWLDGLEQALAACTRPAVVIAHSLGCITLAHYSARRPHAIAAALLVAPADVERAGVPAELAGFGPIPRHALPFPARVVASDNDPFCSLPRARLLARDWGCACSTLAQAGHINVASGHHRWEAGFSLLADLLAGVQTSVPVASMNEADAGLSTSL